ncbi:MAG: Glu/Leu/Phe/Val dehydrogenase dimerization domain-containing protein [Longimicrobiales bacterium]
MRIEPPADSTWARYGAYLQAPPEQVLEWHDPETEARGWLVINSLRGGAAGGGTRMRRGVTLEEVTYLAKAMQLKFAYSGPPIGGGKSGIDFDPEDPRRDGVLRRWYRAVQPFLTTRYGTGGDVNVDEQKDVVPLCAELGIRHPQEGIVRGHLALEDGELTRAFEALRRGIRQAAGPGYGVEGLDLTVSDVVTGYGVARACRRMYERRGRSLEGVRTVVEGFGNVGGAAALHLARMGARVVGIVDRQAGLVSPEGLEAADVEVLLRRRDARALPDHPLVVRGPEREFAYRGESELFVPAAISGSVDARRLAQLTRHGVGSIVCGANQPFAEVRLGETHTAQAADAQFDVMPEVVASQGMARTFYHLMTGRGEPDAGQIFEAVGAAVDQGVDAVVDRAGEGPYGLMAAALALALERVEPEPGKAL